MEHDHPIVVIKRVGKRQMLSDRAIQEQEQVNSRIKKAGSLFDFVAKELKNVFHKDLNFTELRNIASTAVKGTNIKIDRLSKRNKNAMLCWYCENWDAIRGTIEKMGDNKSDPDNSSNQEDFVIDESFVVPTKDPKKFRCSLFTPLIVF